jgi:hypothetical protein
MLYEVGPFPFYTRIVRRPWQVKGQGYIFIGARAYSQHGKASMSISTHCQALTEFEKLQISAYIHRDR